MKRSASITNSSLIETTNNHSPKRSCIQRNKLFVASNSSSACSSSSPDRLSMEDHIQSLISMGFGDRDFNRKVLIKTNNDISEAVTILTGSSYFDDDVFASPEIKTSTFIGPRTKEHVEQQQQQQRTVPSNHHLNGAFTVVSDDLSIECDEAFTTDAFLDLETKVYGDNWSIPYKRDEALGQCLLSATQLALAGKADEDRNCVKFMENLIPDAFRKLQCSHHVNNWAPEIQAGVFDMVELLIDLVAARLSYTPTPVRLLETLGILFDYDSVFQRKNKSKTYSRSLHDKQLPERTLANPPSSSPFQVYGRNETYGWLCQIINRFVSKDGIVNLKDQFQSETPLTALEYHALLSPFVNCMNYIQLDKYRQLFNEHIEQAMACIRSLKEEDYKAKSINSVFDLLSTLRKICSIVWPNRIEQIEQLHLNLLLEMIALSNFNSKMNSLKELAKMIENCTMNIQSVPKSSIKRETMSEWIIANSVLSKALEGNIDQNQYVDKVRTLMEFIAPKISKGDIETIWKMQHGHSLVAVDHLFTLIASAAAKFNLQQLNYLIEFIYNSWKNETVLIQEKLIELLGAIGRECQKESAARVLEILWDMAHESRLSRSMLDQLLQSHLRIFSEGRQPYDGLKREYCLKCMVDLQRKQGWLVPAIKHLYDLLHHDSTNTFKRTDQDLISLLAVKHDLIAALIQSLSTCQIDVWNQTHGCVNIDTLVDGRYRHEESIQNHLDLLSFLLKRGNLSLILTRSEELWDTLITNEHASSFDHELGLNWFITCVEDLSQDCQITLFEKRVSKLDPIHLSSKGYACFKLYFERWRQSKPFVSSLSITTNNETSDHHGISELWNIILCVNDDHLASDATRFLLDLYYYKKPNRMRCVTPQVLHESFLNEVYTRLSYLLRTAVPPAAPLTEDIKQFYDLLKVSGEQFPIKCSSSPTDQIDHTLWLQKIERLLMITEEYIHIVEHEHSPTAHITSFHGLEYQIKFVLGEIGKTNGSYDIITVHANDTLEMLRTRLGQFYKVPPHDVNISIQNTHPLPQLYDYSTVNGSNNPTNTSVLGLLMNSKYLYQVYINPGTTIYIKIFGNVSNQPTKSANSNPLCINLASSSLPTATRINHSNIHTYGDITRSTPSNMLAENSKVYDILYKLSFLNDESIHQRIRNLLNLMPSDARTVNYLDCISDRSTKAYTIERRPSTESCTANDNTNQITCKETMECVFDINNHSLIQLLYNLEVLSSKLLSLSTDNGTQQSSKLFRQDFLEQSGVESLFQLLDSLNHLTYDDYEYSLYQEITKLILQMIHLLVCGVNHLNELHSSSTPMQMSPSSSSLSLHTANDSTSDTTESEVSITVEHLPFADFVEQIKQLIFLGWAAAAGNIRLHGQTLSVREQVKLDRHELLQQINVNVFSRNNSRNSVTHESQGTGDEQKMVKFGICVKKNSISSLDSAIAEEIIAIVTFCLMKRPEFIATFLVQPFFADFLLEILIGTSSREVRQCALRHIIHLCQIPTSACDIRSLVHQILLKARLPLWSSSSSGTRGTNQKLISQSIEYFDLRCHLTENLTRKKQKILNINAKQLLAHEFQWLSTYTVSVASNELRAIDNILFMGHLKLVRTLLTCENMDKNELGSDFIHLLIDQFLFPASKRMSSSNHANDITDDSIFEPKCSTNDSRLAAYDVLVELVRHCEANLKLVVEELIDLHHRPLLEKQTEWEFMPQVNPRASCGFVGLYNGGATCYMNSILQQLYMLPQISEYILSVHNEDEQTDDSKLFHQLQQVFGHLMESKMQYYAPEALWKVFRLWGQEINVREQQDAFDFFTAMTDQIDEYLKSIKREEVFHKQFEGIFCNQMICTNGCRHRYEGEEKFMALNVAIKVDSLNESLNQFVRGEVLDGNNAYFCAKCQEKRTTIKRLCIKKLPPLLCIQMKRFGFDWENNRALKFDDHFKFPFVLNMEPYTLDGVNRRESFVERDDPTTQESSNNSSTMKRSESKSFSRTSSSMSTTSSTVPSMNYELIGIVVHSGQANAGHYYSFIKDTRGRYSTNPDQWYRFNDTTVEEIQLTEQMLEEECFGGTFRTQNTNNSNEERTRFWNAYILIYQCIERSKFLPPPSSPVAHRLPTACRARRNPHDSLSQLNDLVVQSEHDDLFQMKNSLIPSNVLACVKDENLQFLKNRDTYCEDYFQLISNLVNTCFDEIHLSNDPQCTDSHSTSSSYALCTKLALNFLFNTHLHTHYRLRKDQSQQWIQFFSRLFSKDAASCELFYQFLLEKNEERLKLYLLDCPIEDIRQIFEQICENVLQASDAHGEQKSSQIFLTQLIALLDKAVVEQVKHSHTYFQLLYMYISMNNRSIEHLLELNTFIRLMTFLLGDNIDSRRWNSGQAKEVGIIHEIISMLTLFSYTTNENTSQLHPNMKIYFFGQWSSRYLKEICYAFQEVSSAKLTRTLELMKTLATDNNGFSRQLIRILLQSIAQAHTNDFKSLFKLLSHILLIEDSYRFKRLQLAFEGVSELSNTDNCQAFNGLYSLIQSSINTEQRRAYQIVKFLVTISNKNKDCKRYFSSTATRWETAIDWLKQQMQPSWQWSPAQNVSNEDNDARSFQRTRSAQFTLEQAQSLLRRTNTPTGMMSNENVHPKVLTSQFLELDDEHSHSSSSSQSTLIGNDADPSSSFV